MLTVDMRNSGWLDTTVTNLRMPSDRDVVICECFARDGLQHEGDALSTDDKVDMLTRTHGAGFTRIEATSYSHPKRVPGFADASEVLARIPRSEGVAYKATCPNPRAVERALADLEAGHGAEEISLLVSATDSHSERNLRATREEQWARVEEMIRLADGRFSLVGVVSVALGCPFEGEVPVSSVVADAERFASMGVELLTVGDTTGDGTPRSVRELFGALLRDVPQITPVAHFHDSRGTAIANAMAAMEVGTTHFDTALGGVGGHPATIQYGGGATGNAVTEDLVFLLERMGVRTGIDLEQLEDLSLKSEELLGRPLDSKVAMNQIRPRRSTNA